jgi:L-threonylcarbamoyladenylate synthase
MVSEYVEPLTPQAKRVMKQFWPGGLTLVLKCRVGKVSKLVRGNGSTVGIRIPKHKTIVELIRAVGVPILAPSANFAGGKTPFMRNNIDPDLLSKVDFILLGRCKIKKPSTVMDISQAEWKILREGAVKIKP